jgi:hypothetical protein
MKTVEYVKKSTSANTEYRWCRSQDLRWILSQSGRIVELAELLSEDVVRFNLARPDLPRQGSGKRNSIHTLCQGIIDNFAGGQYDLTARQCEGLEVAFRVAEEMIEDFEAVEFREVVALPKMTSCVREVPNTTFPDLFDIELTIKIDRRA